MSFIKIKKAKITLALVTLASFWLLVYLFQKTLYIICLSILWQWMWLETLTCNETKSSAFRGMWLETLMCNETKCSAFCGLWLETLTCNETKSSAFHGLWLETLTRHGILSYVSGNRFVVKGQRSYKIGYPDYSS
jgi:hypothetical protein